MKRELLEKRLSADFQGWISLWYLRESGQYATWRSNKNALEETYWGHYFDNLKEAKADYDRRS